MLFCYFGGGPGSICMTVKPILLGYEIPEVHNRKGAEVSPDSTVITDHGSCLCLCMVQKICTTLHLSPFASLPKPKSQTMTQLTMFIVSFQTTAFFE